MKGKKIWNSFELYFLAIYTLTFFHLLLFVRYSCKKWIVKLLRLIKRKLLREPFFMLQHKYKQNAKAKFWLDTLLIIFNFTRLGWTQRFQKEVRLKKSLWLVWNILWLIFLIESLCLYFCKNNLILSRLFTHVL